MKNPRFQFVMVKPKAVALNLTETFFKEFKKKDLVLVWQKRACFQDQARELIFGQKHPRQKDGEKNHPGTSPRFFP